MLAQSSKEASERKNLKMREVQRVSMSCRLEAALQLNSEVRPEAP